MGAGRADIKTQGNLDGQKLLNSQSRFRDILSYRSGARFTQRQVDRTDIARIESWTCANKKIFEVHSWT